MSVSSSNELALDETVSVSKEDCAEQLSDLVAAPTAELSENGEHLEVGMILDTGGSDERSVSSAVHIEEMEPEAVDVTRNLVALQAELENRSCIEHLEHPEPGTSTIANTAADVIHIRENLDELQEHLSRIYPMTDEEKLACKAPITDLSQTSHGSSVEQSSKKSGELSLLEACAVLRGASKSHSSRNSSLRVPTLLPNMGDPSDSVASAFGTRDLKTSLRPNDESDALVQPSTCGSELRLATQVLKRRLQVKGR